MEPLAERIAVLETQMDGLKATLDELKEGQALLVATQQQMLLKFAENKGTWGGIVLVVSGIFGALSMAKYWLSSWIK